MLSLQDLSTFILEQTQDQGEVGAEDLNISPGSSSSVIKFDTEVFIDLVRSEP